MQEIKRVEQTTFGDGSEDGKPGNCESACWAMVLGIPLEDVPNFHLQPEGFWQAREQWLAERGYAAVNTSILALRTEDDLLKRLPKPLVCVAGGPAVRGLQHPVVEVHHEDGAIEVLDPHPSCAGLIKVECRELVMVVAPMYQARIDEIEQMRRELWAHQTNADMACQDPCWGCSGCGFADDMGGAVTAADYGTMGPGAKS